MIIGVLVELSNKNIDRVFDYNVPDVFLDKIKLGIRVKVPFGRMKLEGFVVEIKNNTDVSVKDILDVVDDEVILNEELLELGKKMQEDTLSTLISCYQVMLPKALKAKNGTTINKRLDTYYHLKEDNIDYSKLTSKQLEIVKLCLEKKNVIKKELVNISSSSLSTLVKKGILIEELVDHYRVSYNEKIEPKKELTVDQRKVVDEVLKNPLHCTYLLYGVTGSGKTEVYMELIEDALKTGKTSIVLVPEISLTPQMVLRFQKRFGNNIAALHSALSEGEKYDEYIVDETDTHEKRIYAPNYISILNGKPQLKIDGTSSLQSDGYQEINEEMKQDMKDQFQTLFDSIQTKACSTVEKKC